MNENLISEYFQKCRAIDFPYVIPNEESLRRNFNNLLLKCDNKDSTVCYNLINYFHPSIWKCNIKGRLSPYEGWYNDNVLLRTIENRLKYKDEILSPIDIRAGLYISKLAPKVSVFRPALAKYIIKKYLDDFQSIFDPCSGYSGRLLGATVCDKYYQGQDINPITVFESNNVINHFKLKAEVSCKNSLCEKGTYDCLFTCPPYFDKENWDQDIEVLNCDEWIDVCLNNYKCNRYVFVVDKTEKYKEHIVETITNKSYLQNSLEYIVVI